jgi:hypothetical protein
MVRICWVCGEGAGAGDLTCFLLLLLTMMVFLWSGGVWCVGSIFGQRRENGEKEAKKSIRGVGQCIETTISQHYCVGLQRRQRG